MKKILSSTLTLLAVAYFIGCSSSPNSPEVGSVTNEEANGGKTGVLAQNRAVPAWTFAPTYQTINVSDVGLGFNTTIYTASSGRSTWWPTWSASGGSVSFVEMPTLANGESWYTSLAWGNYYIKAVDVAVGSNGKVVSSNTRTIFTATTADSMRITAQAWCPASTGAGSGKIAFMVHTPTQSKIYLVSTSGGTATAIYTVNLTANRLRGESLTWSPDGTKLAFSQYSGTNTADADVAMAIKIIDLSGNIVTSLLDGTRSISGCRWSNSGANKISYNKNDTDLFGIATPSNWNLYTIEATGSTPIQIAAASYLTPAWSPNNAELIASLATGANAGTNRINVSTLTPTLISTTLIRINDWK